MASSSPAIGGLRRRCWLVGRGCDGPGFIRTNLSVPIVPCGAAPLALLVVAFCAVRFIGGVSEVFCWGTGNPALGRGRTAEGCMNRGWKQAARADAQRELRVRGRRNERRLAAEEGGVLGGVVLPLLRQI